MAVRLAADKATAGTEAATYSLKIGKALLFRRRPSYMRCCLLISVVVTFALLTAGQPTAEKVLLENARIYENQQRARKLLALEPEIRSLPDAVIRIQLRHELLKFI